MKTIVVYINKEEVARRVAAEVAYVGAKQGTDGVPLYDKVRIVSEDAGWIEERFAVALTALFSQFSPWLVDCVPSLDVLLRVPLNFDMAQHGVLRRLVDAYLVNALVSEWFALHGLGDIAGGYDTTATSQLDLARQVLNKRVRPRQPLYDEEHNIIARRERREQ